MKYNQPFGAAGADAPYVDQNTPGAIAGSVPPAAAIEHPQREIVAAIAAAGLTPAEGDLAQLAQAMTRTVSGGVLFTDSGVANAHVLTISADFIPPSAYFDGLEVCFVAVAENNGPATVNVEGLGIKSVKRADGTALLPGDINTRLTTARYNAGAGEFRLQPWSLSALPQYFRGSFNVAQSIPYNTWTTIGFTEEIDTLDGWSVNTLTAPVDGLYLSSARVSLNTGTQETNVLSVFNVNGADIWLNRTFAKGASSASINSTSILRLNAGDTLGFRINFTNAAGSGALDATFGQLGIFLVR